MTEALRHEAIDLEVELPVVIVVMNGSEVVDIRLADRQEVTAILAIHNRRGQNKEQEVDG